MSERLYPLTRELPVVTPPEPARRDRWSLLLCRKCQQKYALGNGLLCAPCSLRVAMEGREHG